LDNSDVIPNKESLINIFKEKKDEIIKMTLDIINDGSMRFERDNAVYIEYRNGKLKVGSMVSNRGLNNLPYNYFMLIKPGETPVLDYFLVGWADKIKRAIDLHIKNLEKK
jgi:hypothetical protein